MAATLRYFLITALRDRFLGAILLAVVAAVGGAVFFGASALTERRALGLVFAGELVRLILVVGLITFICFHLRRMYETREIEAILARPISRTAFVFSCFAAYAAISLLLALLLVPLLIATLHAGGAGLALWDVSLMLEGLIVIGLGLFCAMSLESATASVLAALGLYLLGRSAAFFRAIAEAGTGALDQQSLNTGARWVMEGIAAVAPRLDLFGQSRWLVYGPGGGWGLGVLLVQVAIYVPLLLLATIRDLQVRRF